MKQANSYFWYGMAVACVLAVTLTQATTLEAISRSVLVSRLPRELRLGTELGILSFKEIQGNTLDVPISRGEFAAKFQKLLQLLGRAEIANKQSLSGTGIFSSTPARKSLSRGHALEGLARGAIYLSDKALINLDDQSSVVFKDYAPQAKYGPAMSWLQEKSVVRGYPDGRFRAKRAITKREAVYLLYRFYEAVAGHRMMKTTGSNLLFVDLPLEHPVVNDLRVLGEAGAFTYLHLRPSFDGNAPVEWSDVVLMLKGILEKQGFKSAGFLPNWTSKGFTQRQHVALALANFFTHIGIKPDERGDIQRHRDVKPGSQLENCLRILAGQGIHLGYPTGFLKPGELISWFEWIGVVRATLETAEVVTPPVEKSRYAQKADFERFAALIQAKRLRIRRILKREFSN